jgi:4-aminobutyrate aminotransferase-like enzyme
LKNNKQIKEIRQIGLMLAVELNTDNLASKLIQIFLKNGLIVDQFLFDSNSFRIAPPLTISDEEIDFISKIIVQSLDELKTQ